MTTVLVADDDPDIRDLVAFKLEQAGFDVVGVEDGIGALEAATARPPDLALLDVMMPSMTGIDVCRALRERPETAHVPVILLTARIQHNDIQMGLASGAADYIVKPFSPRELMTRVLAVLARVNP